MSVTPPRRWRDLLRHRIVRFAVILVALALIALLMTGCDSRGDRTVWYGQPRIVLCSSQGRILEHAPGFSSFGAEGSWRTLYGVYRRDEDTVYVLSDSEDGRLTIQQALTLAHELQHRADARNHGSMWDVLQDLSDPNLAEGMDFDCHHHKRVSPEGGEP